MDHLTALADFIATGTPDATVRARTALILADSIGAIVGGAAEAEVRALTDRMGATSTGPAPVIGRNLHVAAPVAGFLNGTAGTTLEMDEGNQFCKGHPGMHVIPALLAAASGRPTSGRDLLDAIALGYEAAARVGMATSLRPSMHPHGTWGAIGAATGVMRLNRQKAPTIREAMNIAASLGLTTSRRTMLEGGTVRNVFAGVSNQMGLLAADLVGCGFTGDGDGVGQVFGRVASDSFDAARLSDGLGRRWEVMRNYFKMHSCCRYNHAALDALQIIRDGAGALAVAEIDTIAVETYALAVELDDPAPKNVLAAKFSVPFALATTLVNGSSGVESFAAGMVGNDAIRALAARVSLREDPAMTAQLPDNRPARVTITLRDGRTLRAATETNRGDWKDPYPVAEIRAKFASLTARLWSAPKAAQVWDMILDLDTAPDVADILHLIAEGES